MRPLLTADQQGLVDLAADVFRGRTANEQLQAVEAGDARVDEALWRELAVTGLLGIAVPEEDDGAGRGLLELVLLLEQAGRFLAPVPLWETTTAALALAAHAPQDLRASWLQRVVAGDARLAPALDLDGRGTAVQLRDGSLTGEVLLVPHGHVADLVLVEAADGALLAVAPAADGVARRAVETTSRAYAADLELAAAPVVALAGAAGTYLKDRVRVALAAVQLGVLEEGVREAAGYVSQREQFGRPLATFQAVSQQLADAYCVVEALRATLHQAVWALEAGDRDAARSVDVACWWATEQAARAQHAVQHVHGGIGADTTYPVHRRLLWTMRVSAQLGGPGAQLARLARHVPAAAFA